MPRDDLTRVPTTPLAAPAEATVRAALARRGHPVASRGNHPPPPVADLD